MSNKFKLIKVTRKEAPNANVFFIPCEEADIAEARKLKNLEYVVASRDSKDIRNLLHLRKYWTLVNLVLENLPESMSENIKTKDQLHQEFKVQTGHIEKRMSIGGHEYFAPKSISFEKMSQSDFDEYYEAVLAFVYRHILPNVDKEEFQIALNGYSDGSE